MFTLRYPFGVNKKAAEAAKEAGLQRRRLRSMCGWHGIFTSFTPM